jgi:nucleoside-diphosphate-sugar epimerase
MPKKILITGASGFIGSFLVDEALKRGYDVAAGVREKSSRKFLGDPRLRFLELDYASTESLARLLSSESFDYVIHNAGTTGTKGNGEFQTVNFNYTRHLIDALRECSRPPEKFLFMSSLAVMGPGNPETLEPLRVGDPERPVSAYGQSKLAAERYLVSASPFPFVILRPTAVIGPRDRDFLSLFRWIRRGIQPRVGTHRQKLSMIYVKDLATAALDLIALPQAKSCYIASDTQAYDQEDLGAIISRLMGRRTLHLRVPIPVLRPLINASEAAHRLFGQHPFLSVDKLREIEAANWLCDSSGLWNDLGRKPAYTLEHGLKETWEWYREHGWV